jgi:hypothetical protein
MKPSDILNEGHKYLEQRWTEAAQRAATKKRYVSDIMERSGLTEADGWELLERDDGTLAIHHPDLRDDATLMHVYPDLASGHIDWQIGNAKGSFGPRSREHDGYRDDQHHRLATIGKLVLAMDGEWVESW